MGNKNFPVSVCKGWIWTKASITISFSCRRAESCLSFAALHSDCCWIRSKWKRTNSFRCATSLASSWYLLESSAKLVWYMWSVSQGSPTYLITLSSDGDWDLKLSLGVLLFLLVGVFLFVFRKFGSVCTTEAVDRDTASTDSAITFKSDVAPRMSSMPWLIWILRKTRWLHKRSWILKLFERKLF